MRKVALIPPNIVYKTTPIGSKKQAAAVGIPVKVLTTADPPKYLAQEIRWITCQQHSGDENVRHNTEYEINYMSNFTITCSNNFKESMGSGGASLQLDR